VVIPSESLELMQPMPSMALVVAGLLTVGVSLGTSLELWFQGWAGNRADSSGLWNMLLGDSRRLFANHFFVKADEYFHSGYYPSIFDQVETPKKTHMEEETAPAKKGEPDDLPNFLGEPKDWIARFGRHFIPTQHRHLEESGQVGEILPWLRISADLDPQNIATYTIAAYWLRMRMGRVNEAEQFLREGLRANPDSYEILFELGRLYAENRHEAERARNIWELALRRWQQREGRKPNPDTFGLEQIVGHLAQVEEQMEHWAQAIAYLEKLKSISPLPGDIQKQIDALKAKAKPSTDIR
jgi:tetratricopeptide (TPR) repeat protein